MHYINEFQPSDYDSPQEAWSELKIQISKEIKIHNYYEVLIELLDEVLREVDMTSGLAVAQEIKMSPSKMSYVVQMLRAIRAVNSKKTS